MAFFSGLFGSFSGLCPTPRRKGEPPYHGKERLRRKPISTPRQQGQLSSRRADLHSKKEWGPLTARKIGKKEGPTTAEEKKPTPRNKGQPTISRKGQFEGRAKTHTKKTGPKNDRSTPTPRRMRQQPHLEKEGPNTNPERRGPTHPEKGGPTFTPRARSKNCQTLHSKKVWRTSLH